MYIKVLFPFGRLRSSLAKPVDEAVWTKGPKFTSDPKNISAQAPFVPLALRPGSHGSVFFFLVKPAGS